MTTAVRDDVILKLHTSQDGVLWFADGDRMPASSGVTADEFVQSLSVREPLYIRMLGTHDNAPAITHLYPRCLRSNGRLEVATPLVCATRAEQNDPEIALYRMRQCNFSSSLGGWHAVSSTDHPAYAMVTQFHRDRCYSSHCEKLLVLHPAWYDLSFIGGIQPAAASMVLNLIIDPRWYIDQRQPYRLARLRSYLGLYDCTQRVVSASDCKHIDLSPRQVKCAAVRAAWKGVSAQRPANMNAPENFLWRIWDHHGRGWRGDLLASSAFVAYLARTWQQQIVDRSPSGQKIEMFLPDSMFTPTEAAAYRQHDSLRPRRV